MAIAAISAFVIPARITDRAVPQLQVLLTPISAPVRSIAGAISSRVAPVEVADARPDEVIRRQNDALAQENVKLLHDVDDLRRINGEREKVGNIRDLCTPVPVVGTDSGRGDSLAVRGSSLDGLRDGMFVLFENDIVGTLQRSGIGGGQVKLVTSTGFKATAYFGAFRDDDQGKPHFVRLNRQPVLVQGAGASGMICQMMTMDEVKQSQLRPGDWAVLEDMDWPAKLQGRRIGKVSEVRQRKDAALFAEIHIKPASDLQRLREVMVLTR